MYKIVKLSFLSNLHIGKSNIWEAESFIKADTIFSALCHEAKKIGNKDLSRLIEITKNNTFKISDAFIFKDKDLFLPKPMLQIKSENSSRKLKKQYKKIDYIPVSKWNSYIKGNEKPEDLLISLNDIRESDISQKIKFEENFEHLLFDVGYVRFKQTSGLYFVLYCNKTDFDFLKNIIVNLSYSGIGGKRSSGYGRFTCTFEEPTKAFLDLLNNNSRYYMNISVAYPKQNEKCNPITTSVIRRGGFITYVTDDNVILNPTRKVDRFHFASGSIFENKFEGDIFNVSPDENYVVYRYAKPIFIGVNYE